MAQAGVGINPNDTFSLSSLISQDTSTNLNFQRGSDNGGSSMINYPISNSRLTMLMDDQRTVTDAGGAAPLSQFSVAE